MEDSPVCPICKGKTKTYDSTYWLSYNPKSKCVIIECLDKWHCGYKRITPEREENEA